ncbi:MAG: hypothetical protein HN576_02365 [Bacteriovoracaceae bacterium]|jgi:hypothetical protein|nr:hypothetical protein [Bacteriovoracaceae bacterium]
MKKNNDKGQSTVEFLMTFVFIFGIMFVYVKIALNFTRGYMIHLANYQASRAYLISDLNSNDSSGSDSKATEAATKVWKSYYSDFSGTDIVANSPAFGGSSIFVGTFVEYTEKFSFGFPFSAMDPMELRSESFLGREPTRQTCLERTCKSMKDLGANDCGAHMTLSDNGC